MANVSVVRVRSAKAGAINSRKNRLPPPRAVFKDGKVRPHVYPNRSSLTCLFLLYLHLDIFPYTFISMSHSILNHPSTQQRINPAVAAAMAAKTAEGQKA